MQGTVFDYISLLKPRVMALSIFTSVCGLLIAPISLHPLLSFIAIFSIALGAGGAGCLNMWYERDKDSLMERTKNRPLPQHKIDKDTALSFGIILSTGSVFLMAVSINYTAAFLLAFTIFFYVVVYTIYLKPRTPQNIVIGGLSGALPPLIGWVAATGTIASPPLILVLIIFFWTIPHFWALSLVMMDDYARAKFPMMPNVKGKHHTKKHIVMYSYGTALSPLLLYFIGFSGKIVLITSLILGVPFLYYAHDLYRKKKGGEIKLFTYSILYLFLLFLSIVIDHGVCLS